MQYPFITIVIPTLNEEANIRPLLQEISRQCQGIPHEIFVSDGGSNDRTIQEIEHSGVQVRVIHNARRIQSCGVNLAAKEANPRSEYLIRIDAHSSYPENFIIGLITASRETGASSVVVPLISDANVYQSEFAKASAIAQLSKAGNGGAAHRVVNGSSSWVDHGHHALFVLSTFRAAGGYDEAFATNEDAEFDYRLTKSGHRIWLAANLPVLYFPRDSASKLAKQYYRYGVGRAQTVAKHGTRLKLRQMAPVAILIANFASIAFAFANLNPLFLLVPTTYLSLIFLAINSTRIDALRLSLLATAAAAIMHHSWGVGFLHGTARKLWETVRKN